MSNSLNIKVQLQSLKYSQRLFLLDLEEVQNIPLATKRLKDPEPEQKEIEEDKGPTFSKAELLEMQLRATTFELAEE